MAGGDVHVSLQALLGAGKTKIMADIDSVMDLQPSEEQKLNAIDCIKRELDKVTHMDDKTLKQICMPCIDASPKQKKKHYISSLKHLLRRFQLTTNARDGGQAFKDDVCQLLLNLETVIKSGLARKPAKFQKYVKEAKKLQIF